MPSQIAFALVALAILVTAGSAALLARRWRERSRAVTLAQRQAIYRQLLTDIVGQVADDKLAVPAPDPLDIDVVEKLLKSRLSLITGEDRARFVSLLATLGFVEPYVSRLSHSDFHVRAKACEVLGNMEVRRACSPLLTRLDDPEPEVRMVAARALAKTLRAAEFLGDSPNASVPDDQGLDPQQVIKALSAQLRQANRWIRLSLVESLETIGGDVVSVLDGELNTPDEMVRAMITDTLGRLRDVKAVPALIGRLTDESAEVRTRACEALGLIGAPSSVPALVGMVKDPAWQVKAQAAKALGLIGSPVAIPALRQGLKDGNWWVRSNSANSLAQMGGEGLGVLLDLLHSDDQFARERAAEELQRRSQVGMILTRWRELHTAEDRSILVNLCRAGSPSPVTGLLLDVVPAEQAEVISIIEESLRTIEQDLASRVSRREAISTRAYRKIQGTNLIPRIRELNTTTAEAAAAKERTLALISRIEEQVRALEPPPPQPPSPKRRRSLKNRLGWH